MVVRVIVTVSDTCVVVVVTVDVVSWYTTNVHPSVWPAKLSCAITSWMVLKQYRTPTPSQFASCSTVHRESAEHKSWANTRLFA